VSLSGLPNLFSGTVCGCCASPIIPAVSRKAFGLFRPHRRNGTSLLRTPGSFSRLQSYGKFAENKHCRKYFREFAYEYEKKWLFLPSDWEKSLSETY